MAKPPAFDIPSAGRRPPARDLSDAEFAELDDLLAATPQPLEPLDVVMLDGYLCGVLVQPQLIAPEEFLPPVFDYDRRPLPPGADPAWQARCTELILRRHAALNQALVDQGWFDPLILEDDPDADGAAQPADPLTVDGWRASSELAGGAITVPDLPAISRALMPWVAGFQHATLCFPALSELPDDDVSMALARLFRHLPAETEEEREVVATMDREFPLADLDAAVEELVGSVADLADLTQDARYRVPTVQRATPKVGRNDPCPCGSGKKYKACHGA